MHLTLTLTSTSARLVVLKHTLISLLDQSYRPDRIVLCISEEPYLIDEGVKELPSWLNEIVEKGSLEINWVENTGPYRKLMPIFRQASDDDWILTCDDDVIYGPNWVSSLVRLGHDYPSAIICGRARLPVKNPWGRWQSYLHWPIAPPGSKGNNLLPIGIAGVLYRKPLLDRAIMFNDDFKKLAPKQDDLWFNLARQLANTVVVVSEEADKQVFPIEAPGALSETNISTNSSGWNSFFRAIFDRFILRLKGYMGISVCGNDVVIKKLDVYKKSLSKETD